MIYRTVDSDMVDKICFDYYGRCNAAEEVIILNPHVAEIGTILPAGVLINLPVLTEQKKTISLFD